MEHIIKITKFIVESFIHIWPYLLITIPVAVLVNSTNASKHIKRVLGLKPVLSIFLATAVGAFSPFCSCGVIPIIASMLISGVPLAPVMSFWIASPSMDPEIFLLSTSIIGWDLSVWRLVATFVISLFSGYITHLLVKKNSFGEQILKGNLSNNKQFSVLKIIRKAFSDLRRAFNPDRSQKRMAVQVQNSCCSMGSNTINYSIPVSKLVVDPGNREKPTRDCTENSCKSIKPTLGKKLVNESVKAFWMVSRFMILAFFINAIIQFYVPQDFFTNLMGSNGFSSIAIASLVGIPFYTSNLTALPIISGMLQLGLNEGAALAFLISGPITTLPAMTAVWGLVRTKIFILYILFALVGSIAFGVLFSLLG